LKEVLDTRFLREYFYSAQPETKEKIVRKYSALISHNEGILPTIVIAEFTQITCVLRGKDMAKSRYQSLMQSGLEIQDLTADIAEHAGLLKCQYSNLPMGDCVIAATALVKNARIISDDPHFDLIKEVKRNWI
jgi:predicted nucleic acid-binding protein